MKDDGIKYNGTKRNDTKRPVPKRLKLPPADLQQRISVPSLPFPIPSSPICRKNSPLILLTSSPPHLLILLILLILPQPRTKTPNPNPNPTPPAKSPGPNQSTMAIPKLRLNTQLQLQFQNSRAVDGRCGACLTSRHAAEKREADE